MIGDLIQHMVPSLSSAAYGVLCPAAGQQLMHHKAEELTEQGTGWCGDVP